MRTPHQTLRTLIDAQNSDALRQFLNDNPDLDLNKITASGVSALWYAIMPPQDKSVSTEIVEVLIATNRVDPTQQYCGCRLYNVAKMKANEVVFHILSVYENQYQYQHNARQPRNQAVLQLPEELAAAELRRIAQGSQNTHDIILVTAVDNAIARLYEHYGAATLVVIDTQIIALTKLLTELEKKINTIPDKIIYDHDTEKSILEWKNKKNVHPEEINQAIARLKKNAASLNLKKLKDAEFAINRICSRNTSTRDYKLADGHIITLTNAAVLALMFQAASDKDPKSFVDGADMSDTEVLQRQIRLIQHLEKTQNEYRENGPACWMGTRNQIVASLDMTHRDIHIAAEMPLTRELIAMQYIAFCKNALEELEKMDPEKFSHYVFYYSLRDLPGGFNGANETIPDDLKEWITSIQNNFSETIRNANRENKKSLPKDDVDTIFKELLTDLTFTEDFEKPFYSLHDSGYLPITALRKLSEIASIPYGELATLIPTQKITDALRMPGNLSEKLATLKNDLIENVDLSAFFTHLKTHDQSLLSNKNSKIILEYKESALYAAIEAFNLLMSDQTSTSKEIILKNMWPVTLEAWISGTDTKLPEKILWETCQQQLSLAIPQLENWLKNLPEEIRILFFKQLIEKKLFTGFVKNKNDIVYVAFSEVVLEQGYLNDFQIPEKLVIENKDCRGMDLREIDFGKVHFKNCNLGLTGVEDNPRFLLVKNDFKMGVGFFECNVGLYFLLDNNDGLLVSNNETLESILSMISDRKDFLNSAFLLKLVKTAVFPTDTTFLQKIVCCAQCNDEVLWAVILRCHNFEYRHTQLVNNIINHKECNEGMLSYIMRHTSYITIVHILQGTKSVDVLQGALTIFSGLKFYSNYSNSNERDHNNNCNIRNLLAGHTSMTPALLVQLADSVTDRGKFYEPSFLGQANEVVILDKINHNPQANKAVKATAHKRRLFLRSLVDIIDRLNSYIESDSALTNCRLTSPEPAFFTLGKNYQFKQAILHAAKFLREHFSSQHAFGDKDQNYYNAPATKIDALIRLSDAMQSYHRVCAHFQNKNTDYADCLLECVAIMNLSFEEMKTFFVAQAPTNVEEIQHCVTLMGMMACCIKHEIDIHPAIDLLFREQLKTAYLKHASKISNANNDIFGDGACFYECVQRLQARSCDKDGREKTSDAAYQTLKDFNALPDISIHPKPR